MKDAILAVSILDDSQTAATANMQVGANGRRLYSPAPALAPTIVIKAIEGPSTASSQRSGGLSAGFHPIQITIIGAVRITANNKLSINRCATKPLSNDSLRNCKWPIIETPFST